MILLRPKLDKGHHSIPAAETIQDLDHSSAGIGTLQYFERDVKVLAKSKNIARGTIDPGY